MRVRAAIPEHIPTLARQWGEHPVNVQSVRSVEEYLQQLRAALRGEPAAVIQEALEAYAAHLRAEVAANPDKPEGEVLALITSTYGAPEDVAAVYRTQAD